MYHCRVVLIALCVAGRLVAVRSHPQFSTGQPSTDEGEYLEFLAFKYGGDKGKDDHKYVDAYASLFEDRRFAVKQVVELGFFRGQSIHIWHDYFPNAQIHALDLYFHYDPVLLKSLQMLNRVHLHKCDAYDPKCSKALFTPNSVDIIIDDVIHDSRRQQMMLAVFWDYLKPGGLYVIEDVVKRGGFDYDQMEDLEPFTRAVFKKNHVFSIDTSIGHRNWTGYNAKYASHNSNLVVIRKRRGNVPPIQINTNMPFITFQRASVASRGST